MNNTKLLKRKQIRLKGYDYSQNGAYFVTICTQGRQEIFGSVVGEHHDAPDEPFKMVLNNLGGIVESVWESLPNRFPVIIDTYQIIPNHFHGIITINHSVVDNHVIRPTLGNVIAYFKYQSTKQINALSVGARFSRPIKGSENPTPTFQKYQKIFQRNFYEHVIRNESELNRIREYITTNPAMWNKDRDNPELINPVFISVD